MESLGSDRRPSEVERPQRPLARPVGLLQPQLKCCHGSVPQLNLAQVGNEPAGAILCDHYRKVIGFRRERNDGAQWNRDGGMRNLTQADRRDHARLQIDGRDC